MKFNLDIHERILLLDILSGFKGSRADIVLSDDVIRQLIISDEEKKLINFSSTVQDDGKIFYQWDEPKKGDKTVPQTKEVEIPSEILSYFVKYFADRDSKGDFSIADKKIIELSKKLESQAEVSQK